MRVIMAHCGVEGAEGEWRRMRGRKRQAQEQADDFWRRYELTPEQKAEARKHLEAQTEEAARNRIWERFLELEGKVHFDIDVDELREDRD